MTSKWKTTLWTLGLAAAWSALFGVLGLILLGLLFTDHTFSTWNENLFLAHPLLLIVSLSLPLSEVRPAWSARARSAAGICAGIAILGLIWQAVPASAHQNAMFFALLLPAHMGLAWGLHAIGQDGSNVGRGTRG